VLVPVSVISVDLISAEEEKEKSFHRVSFYKVKKAQIINIISVLL